MTILPKKHKPPGSGPAASSGVSGSPMEPMGAQGMAPVENASPDNVGHDEQVRNPKIQTRQLSLIVHVTRPAPDPVQSYIFNGSKPCPTMTFLKRFYMIHF